MGKNAVKKKRDKDENIQLPFPDFRGPQGPAAVSPIGQRGIGIDDAVVSAGRMAEGVAVHEIGHPADRLPEDNGRGEKVAESPGVNMMDPRVYNAGCGAEEQAALDSHAALPDVRDFGEMIVVVRPVKKEDVPEPAADDAGEAATEGKVENMKMPAAAVFFHNVKGRDACRYDSEHKEQAVGANGKGPDIKEILMHAERLPCV